MSQDAKQSRLRRYLIALALVVVGVILLALVVGVLFGNRAARPPVSLTAVVTDIAEAFTPTAAQLTTVMPPPATSTLGSEPGLEPETATPSIAESTRPSLTEIANVPKPPLVIANANLLIRNEVSGDVIGDGTLRIFAPSSARYPETARVELELHLDNLYITPTPNGGQGTPVPRATTTSGSTTNTPAAPIITDTGIPVYQRMGATLLCSISSFQGCDAGRDLQQAKIIASHVTTWSWIILPNEGVSGLQDLRLEVWLVQRNLDGGLEYLDLSGTPYRFTIQVNPAGGVSPLTIILSLAVVIALAAGLFWWRRGKSGETVQQAKSGSQHHSLVFISYRRGPSWGQARSIEQSLRERGANVFIDIDDINEGRFAETIEKAIQDCDYFVAVLAPGTLDSVWVRREIAYALSCKKIIIPLLVDGFHMNQTNLPPEIRDIASHNAITVLPEFYEEAMNRLAKRFLRLNE